MRLDAELRNHLLAFFPDEHDRRVVAFLLVGIPEPVSVVCARKIEGDGTIDSRILVITQDKVGFGWPMKRPLWSR